MSAETQAKRPAMKKLPHVNRREVRAAEPRSETPAATSPAPSSDVSGMGHKFNLNLAESQEAVDKINKKFYERFNFPPLPVMFESISDPNFGTMMLNQDVGSFRHDRIPRAPRIWIAGCGTNQSVYTALKFPQAEILGTDISTVSLETCERSARQLGIDNLTLKEESINAARYEGEFDYVICTGVIHHNADPGKPLERLAKALAPNGVMQMMVYNYYHRYLTTAYQKAIHFLCGGTSSLDMELELELTRKLSENFPIDSMMGPFLADLQGYSDSTLADALLQPVEHSYTIETFNELLARKGLEYLLHCITAFDRAGDNYTWNIQFDDLEIEERYMALSDVERWSISNLLMLDKSPMLWFYLQRKGSERPRKSEKEVCEEFLATRFDKWQVERRIFRKSSEGAYSKEPEVTPLPSPPSPRDELARRCFEGVDPSKTMREVFREQGVEASFYNVNRVRIHLATDAYPYLKAMVE